MTLAEYAARIEEAASKVGLDLSQCQVRLFPSKSGWHFCEILIPSSKGDEDDEIVMWSSTDTVEALARYMTSALKRRYAN